MRWQALACARCVVIVGNVLVAPSQAYPPPVDNETLLNSTITKGLRGIIKLAYLRIPSQILGSIYTPIGRPRDAPRLTRYQLGQPRRMMVQAPERP